MKRRQATKDRIPAYNDAPSPDKVENPAGQDVVVDELDEVAEGFGGERETEVGQLHSGVQHVPRGEREADPVGDVGKPGYPRRHLEELGDHPIGLNEKARSF